MSDEYRIVEVRREPLPSGRGGVRVRARLTGCPSRRWSRGVSARLAGELVGRAAVGHLQPDRVVVEDQIVLDSGEASQAPLLAGALMRAVRETNHPGSGHQTLAASLPAEEMAQRAGALTSALPTAMSSPMVAAPPGDRVEPSRWFG